MTNTELAEALVEGAVHYQEKVPVYALERSGRMYGEETAIQVGAHFCELHGIDAATNSVRRDKERSVIEFPEGVRAVVYAASGALRITRGWPDHERPLERDAASVDKEAMVVQAEAHCERLGIRPRHEQGLEFERLWQVKSTGRSSSGDRAPVMVERAIGALRRHVGGLPVWGRASVHVSMAEKGALADVGIDWREIEPEPIDTATVVDPAEGARRVVAELAGFRPQSEAKGPSYSVQLFSLGYVSLPRRRVQEVMQPVWVAMLRAEERLMVNRLIVVPAAEKAYEPIGRLVSAPPVDRSRARVT